MSDIYKVRPCPISGCESQFASLSKRELSALQCKAPAGGAHALVLQIENKIWPEITSDRSQIPANLTNLELIEIKSLFKIRI